MEEYILALDQGTTSSRAVLFNRDSQMMALGQREFRQIFPQPGWVEHDPWEILGSQLAAARQALEMGCPDSRKIAAIGITNQRETVLMWEKASGQPVCNAIVWQCRRSAAICDRLRQAGYAGEIRNRTGLVIDAYFSATKICWLLDHLSGLRLRAEKGEILFGTVDSWLIYNLTGQHVTDFSNASRTMLFNIHTGEWDQEILKTLQIPQPILPSVVLSAGIVGHTRQGIFSHPIPIAGIAGDQQAALFGQTCFKAGEIKNTYGTGCFVLMNTGKTAIPSQHNLLSTIAWNTGEGINYALEGAVFIAGAAVQWLRDQLGIIKNAAETEELAFSVPNAGGITFVPAFVGLGAPYWDSEVRGIIAGLTRGSGKAHIVRATLESIAFQVKDLFTAIEKDTGRSITSLKVDGGASQNRFLMQFQADLLGIRIERPVCIETTALGAAYLAGLGSGFWTTRDEIKQKAAADTVFSPEISAEARALLLADWQTAIARACFKKN